MFRPLALAAACLLLTDLASAQVLIIGGSAGKGCFNAVTLNPYPSQRHENECTEAIESGALDRVNLSATLINRGIIRMRRGNFVSSLEDYKRAERLTPNVGAIYLNRGAALIGAGQYDNALASLERSLDLETQEPHSAYYNIGLAYELLNQVEPAYRSYQKAVELKPEWSLPTEALERFTVLSN